jgi:uncharacterized protein
MKVLNLVAFILVIIGGVNWGLFGAIKLDLVATIFGSSDAPLARVVYVLVGLAALYSLTFFRYITNPVKSVA